MSSRVLCVAARCQQCERWVAPRWHRCPWCKRWTGAQRRPTDETFDAELQAFAAMGVASSLWIGLFGVATCEARPVLGACALAIAVAMLSSSFLMLALPTAYWVACGAWTALLVSMVPAALAAPRIGAPALVLPLLISAALWARSPVLRARIAGQLPASAAPRRPGHRSGHCERCDAPAAVVRAPLWVFSAVFVAFRTTGLARELCPRHAVLSAVPATLVTALFGWWSIWGLWWTPMALWANLVDGGASHESFDDSAGLRRRIGWRWMLPELAVVTGLLLFPLSAMQAAEVLVR